VVDGRGGRLLEDADHVEARELARLARRLHLRRVEVGRHRDHRARDARLDPRRHLAREVLVHARLELAEDPRRHLLGAERVRADFDGRILAHPPLDRLDRRRRLAAPRAGRVADQDLLGLRIPRDGRGHGATAEAIGVDDEALLRGVQHRDLGVGGAEIDPHAAIEEHSWAFRPR
jgi:hypothetical protein